jgi:hypothetical protein
MFVPNTIRSVSENVGQDKKSKQAIVPLTEASYSCAVVRAG